MLAIVIAHHQPLGIRYFGKTVHFAAIDLLLVLVEAMGQIPGALPDRNVALDGEGFIGKILGEPRVGFMRLFEGINHRGQGGVGFSLRIDLKDIFLGRIGNAFRPGIKPIEVIKAMVFEINHDDVFHRLEPFRYFAGSYDPGQDQ